MSSFGVSLRRWREERRMSQAALAEAAEISARHLSFVETGRSQPSRQLVLILCSALEVPLAERNRLLTQAGFAPIYPTAGLDDPEMAPVRSAIAFIMERSAPNGVAVYDKRWDLQAANQPFQHVLRWLYAPGEPPQPWNAIRALIDPDELAGLLVNRDELAPLFLERLRRESEGEPSIQPLYERLARRVGPRRMPTGPAPALIPTVLHKDGVTLRLFSTISVLGTALDVVLDGLRIETYFPADEETARFSAALAQAAQDPGASR